MVTRDDLANYRRIVQQRVGDAKSGWLAGLRVGGGGGASGRVPDYVTRHGEKFGSAQTNFNNPAKAEVVIGNHAPGIRNMKFFVELAVKSRKGALAARLRRVIAGVKEDIRKT